MIPAVIFDLDDTLYRELDYVEAAFHQVASHLALKYHLSEQDIFCKIMTLLQKEGRGKLFDHICEIYHLQESIPELVQVYRDTKPVLQLYPDAREVLQILQKRGIKTALITDGCSQVQHHKIDGLSLDGKPLESILDAVLATDDLGTDSQGKAYSKPNPFVYKTCLDTLGVEPEKAIYVGDNPHKDFVGAKSLGMKTVRIIRPEGDHMQAVETADKEADVIIHDLMELMDMIGKD